MRDQQPTCGDKEMPRGARLLVLLAAISLLCPAEAVAREFGTRSFRFPISVEGEPTRSSLFLRFEVQYYNTPLSRFGASALDERERVFFQLADSIRRGDYARAVKVLQPESGEGTAALTAGAKELSVRKSVDLYRAAFGGFENIEVVCQVRAGSRSLFVWEAKTGSARLLRAFSVGTVRNKGLVATEVGMTTPIDLLILYALDASAKQPDAYRPVSNLTLPYQYAMPVDGPGDAGPHPVYLQFDGQRVNFNLFGEKPSPQNEVLSFYRDAYLPLKNRLLDAFFGAHTPKSQAKLRQWYSTMRGDTFNEYVLAVTRAKYVKFLLNADPVYIVFYSSEPSADWGPGTLNYQYVVRDKNSKGLKIANVLYESVLDDFLKNQDLFAQSVLKTP